MYDKHCAYCGRYNCKWLVTLMSGRTVSLCENCKMVTKMNGEAKKCVLIHL